jgi:hypothetical protein
MMTPLPARSANTPDLHRSSPLENTRDTAYDEDANTGYAGNGPQVMATLRNLAISLLYLAGVKEVTRTLQAIARDRNRLLDYLPL